MVALLEIDFFGRCHMRDICQRLGTPKMLKAVTQVGWHIANNPSYLLGRFRSVRGLYSRVQRTIRPRDVPLEIGPLYAISGIRIERTHSGLVQSDHSTDAHFQRLDRNAWSDGIRLTADAVAALREFAQNNPITYRVGPNVHVAADRLSDMSPELRQSTTTAVLTTEHENEVIQRIAGDPAIVDVIERYLGFRPKMIEPYFFWSFRSDVSFEERVARQQTIEYHFDVHGYNFAYVSFYLLDTNRDNGAHVLVEGTHRRKRLSQLLGSARISDAVAEETYGRDKVKLIERPAGEGFFEDTSCYHKALPPAAGDRLMLQLRYS